MESLFSRRLPLTSTIVTDTVKAGPQAVALPLMLPHELLVPLVFCGNSLFDTTRSFERVAAILNGQCSRFLSKTRQSPRVVPVVLLTGSALVEFKMNMKLPTSSNRLEPTDCIRVV